MPLYDIRLQVDLEAKNPREAVIELINSIKEGEDYTFTVKDHQSFICYTVDLDAPADENDESEDAPKGKVEECKPEVHYQP